MANVQNCYSYRCEKALHLSVEKYYVLNVGAAQCREGTAQPTLSA
jgi:hypothetical protein